MKNIESASDKKLKKSLKKVKKEIASLKEKYVLLNAQFQDGVNRNTKSVDFDLIQEISLCTAEIARKSNQLSLIKQELEDRKENAFSASLEIVQMSDKKLKKEIKKAKNKIKYFVSEKESLEKEIAELGELSGMSAPLDKWEELKIERKEVKKDIKRWEARLKELKRERNERRREYGRPAARGKVAESEASIRNFMARDRAVKHIPKKEESTVSLLDGVLYSHNIVTPIFHKGVVTRSSKDFSADKKRFAKNFLAGHTIRTLIDRSDTMQGIKENADKSKVFRASLESLFKNATDRFEGDKKTPTVNVDDFIKQQNIAHEKFRLLKEMKKISDTAKTFVVRKSRDEVKTIIGAPIPILDNVNHEYSIGDAVVFATKDGKSVYSSPFIVRYLIHDGPNDAVGLEKVTSYQ